MMSLSAYGRPSEILRLRVFSLIRPAQGVTSSWSLLMSPEELGQPSKTGEYDVSLLLDSPYITFWASKILNGLKNQPANGPLWDFNYSQYLHIFKKCAMKLNIQLEPYHARHSGPSIDRSRKYRSQLEVQKRGQWKSTKSCVRYEKAARLAGTGAGEEQTVLPHVRAGIRRHHARSQEPAELIFPRRNPKGHYVADLFSGEGDVALACERLGFASREWDIRHGHQCDLTSRKVLRRLKCDVKAGKVLAVMLAPPCSSFSVARDRTKVIRTRDMPWGIPSHLLSHQDWEKIELGNACFRSCFSLIRLLDKFSVPWVLENPHSSKCWYLPFLQRWSCKSHVHTIVADFCQFGTPWKKRTRFLCGNIVRDDLHRLDQHCGGRETCSRTGKPHFLLTGKGPHGQNWTAIAEPYPKRLCDALAYALTASRHYNNFSY